MPLKKLPKLPILWLMATVGLNACTTAPLDYPKQETYALEDTADMRETAEALKWVGGDPEANGFYPLLHGFDAFGARLKLMDAAEQTLDAQYFLMKPDNAGLVFAARMVAAADRGVRVRFLLDDIFTTVEDEDLAALNAHPNIEVRIFNPISRRGLYAINYIGHFSLLNRRMHNKAFVVDNAIAVVGGRNIAGEYYQLETSGEFFDFDMLAVGPIVMSVSTEFDRYWNHELAVPMEALHKEDKRDVLDAAYADLQREMAEAGSSIYADATHTEVINNLNTMAVQPYLAPARVIADDPEKLKNDVSDTFQVVVNEMRSAMLSAKEEIIILTPYLIPREKGIELLKELQARDIHVTVVTNSLATNNHTSVHSAYARYRKAMLEAGVELWEARADAAKITLPDGETQLDKLTLHTKGVLIDREQIFVGSLNFDPRSIDINTEMGLLIDSPELGALLTENVRERVPEIAYQVKLSPEGKLSWHATVDGETVTSTVEPQTNAWQRFMAWFLKIAPEKQL